MTDQIILNLPDEISERAKRIAETTSQPIEAVLLDHLKTLPLALPVLPEDEQAELDALQHLSDDALWTIAREQMPEDAQLRASALLERNAREELAPDEAEALQKLVERADRLMLRKAEAAAILSRRGFAFTQRDFKPQNG